MIPKSQHARALYLETRDFRNRWRQQNTASLRGFSLSSLLNSAELAQFNEDADFAAGEDLLSEPALEAIKNINLFAELLREILSKELA